MVGHLKAAAKKSIQSISSKPHRHTSENGWKGKLAATSHGMRCPTDKGRTPAPGRAGTGFAFCLWCRGRYTAAAAAAGTPTPPPGQLSSLYCWVRAYWSQTHVIWRSGPCGSRAAPLSHGRQGCHADASEPGPLLLSVLTVRRCTHIWISQTLGSENSFLHTCM